MFLRVNHLMRTTTIDITLTDPSRDPVTTKWSWLLVDSFPVAPSIEFMIDEWPLALQTGKEKHLIIIVSLF